jgi:uncharacterized membrane protein
LNIPANDFFRNSSEFMERQNYYPVFRGLVMLMFFWGLFMATPVFSHESVIENVSGNMVSGDTATDDTGTDDGVLNDNAPLVRYCSAVIDSVDQLGPEEAADAFGGMVPFYAARVKGRILDDPFIGITFESLHLVQDAIDHFRMDPEDRIILMVEEDRNHGIGAANILEFDRRIPMGWLVMLFLVSVMALGRMTGLRSLVALTLTVTAVFVFFIPSVASGGNPATGAFLVCLFSTVFTLLCTGGMGRKYFAAICGTLGGVAATFILAWFFNGLLRLTGSMHHETRILCLQLGDSFDYGGLLLAGIVIGALGAIMDVSVSISSALWEVSIAGGGKLSFRELFSSGLSIGRDIMGTMTNTLILAYVGGSLPLLVLLVTQKTDYPFLKLVNFDLIASEILRSLVGSMGLILAIPLTALFSGVFLSRHSIKTEISVEEAGEAF